MLEAIEYTEHPVDVLARASALMGAGTPCALIASVDIQGGAARELGSLAVVAPSGAMSGYMSNGCIDRDIQFQAMTALETGEQTVLRYGHGSANFDLKLPCGGALEVSVDPNPDATAIQAAYADLSARRVASLCFKRADGAPIAFDYFPKPRLGLAGRGAVFRATARAAHTAGFEITLMSPDEQDLADLSDLPAISVTNLTTPGSAPELELDAHSGFLTLFHDHDWEPALLSAALKTPARFIGSLGSVRTHATRVETLRMMGIAEAELDRLNGPIGLVPSLRQAPLIAISAMAEITQRFSQSIVVRHSATNDHPEMRKRA